MADVKFNSLIELIHVLPDQEDWVAYLETLRWGDNVESPYDETSKVCRNKKGYHCKNTHFLSKRKCRKNALILQEVHILFIPSKPLFMK